MRIAVVSDIHGNRPALDAVLAEIERDRVDRLVCLGDVAVGPQPGAALDRIAETGCPVIMGNWDAAFLNGLPQMEGELGEKLVQQAEWASGQLSEPERDLIRGFVPTLELSLGDGLGALFFHGSPRSFDDVILTSTPTEELDDLLAGSDAGVMVGGHTHFQHIRGHRDLVFVNAGSVGLPFRSDPVGEQVRISPWAEYALLTHEEGRLALDLRRVDYDTDAYLASTLETGMPHAQWWADCWVRK
ncbi:MAG: metallophosphoesterase family protein [Gaiellaceae bacterium]